MEKENNNITQLIFILKVLNDYRKRPSSNFI